jgi:hypothetical protein
VASLALLGARVFRLALVSACLLIAGGCRRDAPQPSAKAASPPRPLNLSAAADRAMATLRPQGEAAVGYTRGAHVGIDSLGAIEFRRQASSQAEIQVQSTRFVHPAAVTGVPSRGHPDGSLTIAHGIATERLELNLDGLEQSWRFEADPGGDRDLELQLPLNGIESAQPRPDGALLVAALAGLKLHVTHASWVEANGARTLVPITCASSHCSLVVPRTLLRSSQYPAELDPVWSPQVEVDPSPPYPNNGSAIGLAAAGTDFLAVSQVGSQLELAALKPDGGVVNGGQVGQYGAQTIGHAATETGAAFIWDYSTWVRARLVQGGAAAGSEVQLSSCNGGCGSPKLATVDGGFLAGWINEGIFTLRALDTQTQPVGSTFTVGTAKRLALASSSIGAVGLWSTNGQLVAATISTDGTSGTNHEIAPSPAVNDPDSAFDLASDGTIYLTAYSSSTGVFFRCLTAQGNPTTAPALLSSARGNVLTAFDGTRFIVAWDDGDTTRFVHVTPSCTVVNPGGTELTPLLRRSYNPPRVSAIACRTDLCLVSIGVGYVVRVSGSGAVLDLMPRPLFSTTRDVEHAQPRAVYDGTVYLAAWLDARHYRSVFAARISTQGQLIDTTAFLLGAAGPIVQDLAVASTQGTTAVAWARDNAISSTVVASLLTADGGSIGAAPLVLGTAPLNASIGLTAAAIPGQFLVSWDKGGGNRVAARVTPQGTVLDPGGRSVLAGAEAAASLGAVGSQYLLAYWPLGMTETRGALLDSNAAVLDAGFPLLPSTLGHPPQVWTSPSQFLVKAGDQGVRLGAAGELLDVSPLALPGLFGEPHATFDGNLFVLISGLGVTRVTLDGGVIPPFQGPFAYPSWITSAGAGQSLWLSRDGYQSNRLWAFLFDFSPADGGASCSIAADCLNGICEDGVCCDQPCGNSDPTDCRACSIFAGGISDGTCAPAERGLVCRDDVDVCDRFESCDGLSTVCPPDSVVDAGVLCRNATVNCVAVSSCDGVNKACPDSTIPDGGSCDDFNSCTVGDRCSSGVCVGRELDAGTSCALGNPCAVGQCGAGSCNYVADAPCPAPAACRVGFCSYSLGACTTSVMANGVACDDGQPCTLGDTCQGGVCTPSASRSCVPRHECETGGSCQPLTGDCVFTPVADGTPCDDGLRCTSGDHCQAGRCFGGDAGSMDAGACRAWACDPSTGTLGTVPIDDGQRCDDGDACTITDLCVAGACVAGPGLVCPFRGPCAVSTCDPATGLCIDLLADAGTVCDDGLVCTVADHCELGLCVGERPSCALGDCRRLAVCTSSVSDECPTVDDDDGAPCSNGGQCAGGVCIASRPATCSCTLTPLGSSLFGLTLLAISILRRRRHCD